MKARIAIIFTLLLSFVYMKAYAVLYTSGKTIYQGGRDYQKKADGYRREAQYYLKKADGYLPEAAYCTRKGDIDRAKDYNRRADRAMDDYKMQIRYAANADDKAVDYLEKHPMRSASNEF